MVPACDERTLFGVLPFRTNTNEAVPRYVVRRRGLLTRSDKTSRGFGRCCGAGLAALVEFPVIEVVPFVRLFEIVFGLVMSVNRFRVAVKLAVLSGLFGDEHARRQRMSENQLLDMRCEMHAIDGGAGFFTGELAFEHELRDVLHGELDAVQAVEYRDAGDRAAAYLFVVVAHALAAQGGRAATEAVGHDVVTGWVGG